MSPARRSLVVALALTLAACGAPPPDLAHELAGLPAARSLRGVRLGMPLAALRRARPGLSLHSTELRDSVDGYRVNYVTDAATADSELIEVGAQANLPSREKLVAVWNSTLAEDSRRFGRPSFCVVTTWPMTAQEGSMVTRDVVWKTSSAVLALSGAEGRFRTAHALPGGGTVVEATPTGAGHSFAWTASSRGLLERALTGVLDAVRPSRGSCKAIRLDGAREANGAPLPVMIRGMPGNGGAVTTGSMHVHLRDSVP